MSCLNSIAKGFTEACMQAHEESIEYSLYHTEDFQLA